MWKGRGAEVSAVEYGAPKKTSAIPVRRVSCFKVIVLLGVGVLCGETSIDPFLEITQKLSSPAVDGFRAGVNAFGGAWGGIVDPPMGVGLRSVLGSVGRWRHGGESAGLSVEFGMIAADVILPDFGVARGKAKTDFIAFKMSDGWWIAVVEDHFGIVGGVVAVGFGEKKLRDAEDFDEVLLVRMLRKDGLAMVPNRHK